MRGLVARFIVVSLLVAHWGARATEYAFTKIQIPQAPITVPVGINNSGMVVGWYIGSQMHPFVWEDGVFTHTDFAAPNTSFAGAFGINEGGTIVGEAKVNGVSQGYIRDPGGSFTFFAVPGASSTQAAGINEAGVVVGTWRDQTAQQTSHGFIRAANGSTTTFNFPAGYTGLVSAVDNDGRILYDIWLESDHKNRAYLRETNGSATAILTDYPGASQTYVGGFNQSGDIIGQVLYTVPNTQTVKALAFIRDAAGSFSYVDNPYSPGTTLGADIDDLGQFVGRYGSGTNGGFLATPLWPGDANGSGGVDFADFVILRENFGQSPRGWRDGDFDGDGRVGFGDFQILERGFGLPLGSSQAAIVNDFAMNVPEAHGIAVLAAVLCIFSRRNDRKHSAMEDGT